jgi:serine/alanine adding enzyme
VCSSDLVHGTVFHSISFRQILIRSFGYRCVYHAIVDELNRIHALVPLVAGRNLGFKKAGVSLPFVNYTDICAVSKDAQDFAVEAILTLKERYGLDYIELRLKDQNLDKAGWRANLHNYTFVLPLSEDEEQILALSSGSNRNHVRKVYKKDGFAVSFDSSHLNDFYKVYVRRMKQLGSPAPDIGFFRRFFELLPENSYLLTVLDKETRQVIGGMLLLTSPGNSTLYYPYGANLSEYNNRYLNNFMYWEAVRFGIRKRLRYLDLGRSQADSGTYKYKEQWGAKPVQLKYLVYTGDDKGHQAPDKDSLSFFVEMWKKTPSFVTNPVGKKLIKYLMP